MNHIKILFREYPLTWIVLIALLLGSIVSFLSPNFLTFMNMTNLLKQVSIVAVLAAGQTVVILSGGIDLSVGSILALTAVVIGYLIEHNYPAYMAIPIGMLVGTFAGFINGIVIIFNIGIHPVTIPKIIGKNKKLPAHTQPVTR